VVVFSLRRGLPSFGSQRTNSTFALRTRLRDEAVLRLDIV